MKAANGKNYLTDVADVETLLRLIQSFIYKKFNYLTADR
jgi:hypothetical protein